jgi:hypothetical protein
MDRYTYKVIVLQMPFFLYFDSWLFRSIPQIPV